MPTCESSYSCKHIGTEKKLIKKTSEVICMVLLFAVGGYFSYDSAKRREATLKGYQVTKNHFVNLKSLNMPFVRVESLLMISYVESVLARFT